jgi:hypothetical protein
MQLIQGASLLALALGASAGTIANDKRSLFGGSLDVGASLFGGSSSSVSVVGSAIASCNTKATTCDSSVSQLSASVDVSTSISALVSLNTTIHGAIGTCKTAGSISISDMVTLNAQISSLHTTCGNLITHLVGKKPVVAQLGACDHYTSAIIDIQTNIGLLFDSLIDITADLTLDVSVGSIFGGVSVGVDLDIFASLTSNGGVNGILSLIAGKSHYIQYSLLL